MTTLLVCDGSDHHRRTALQVDPTLTERGFYYPAADVIAIRDAGDDEALLHELLHAVLRDTYATAADPHSHRLVKPLACTLWAAGFRLTQPTQEEQHVRSVRS